ncbi:MAG: CDP-alcohol phosphatidyltransferase family protein [Gemmatimonadaceae bacterium]
MAASRWNIPNALSATRLLGVPVLFLLVDRRPVAWFATLYALLGLTDFLDGRLARAWNQSSAFGSMLDSVADAAYYVSTAYFAWRLFPAYIRPNVPYIVGCLALYTALILVSRVRVGRILLPHTHLSRLAGVLVVVVVFASFAVDTTLALRGVMVLYGVAIAEQLVMIARYGDIPLDTRSILWLLVASAGRPHVSTVLHTRTESAMTRSPMQKASLLAAALFGAAPMAFGLLRAWRTQYDFRMTWMALIATVFAFSVLVAAIGRRRSRHAVFMQALAIFAVSAMLAWGTGYALGAMNGPGAWMVAVILGFCLAVASMFIESARPG